MKTGDSVNPFTPAAGVYPPFLAGRDAPRAWLDADLRRLSEGHPARNEVLVYGPRGHGKAALLSQAGLGRQAAKYGVAYLCLGGRTLRAELLTLLARLAHLEQQERHVKAGFGLFKLLRGSRGSRLGKPAPVAAQPGQATLRGLLDALLDVAHALPGPPAASEGGGAPYTTSITPGRSVEDDVTVDVSSSRATDDA